MPAAPYKATRIYVLVRAQATVGGELPTQVAFMEPSILEAQYSVRQRVGCEAATIRARRPKTHPEAVILERLANVGEVSIFARDPLARSFTHPYEPAPPFDSSQYQRLWVGRIESVEFDAARETVRIDAEGYGKALGEGFVTETYFAKRIFEIVQDLYQDQINGSLGAASASAIQTTGRMALRIEKLDLDGQSVADALTRLAALAGGRVDYGIDRTRTFFFQTRSNPFHASGGFLPSFGADTAVPDASFERDFRDTRTSVRVWGAKPTPSSPRLSYSLESTIGKARWGFRRFEVLRDDLDNYGGLGVVALGELRRRNAAPARTRAKVARDLDHDLDKRALPYVVLRTNRRVPFSYASESRGAPSLAGGFAIHLVRSASNGIPVPIPDTADIALPWHIEFRRKLRVNPTAGQVFTMCAAVRTPAQGGGFAFRIIQFNNAGTHEIRVEWNGTGTPITHLPGSILNTSLSWGLSFRNLQVQLWKDGTSVATAAVSNNWILHGASGLIVGASETLGNFDDADYQDFAIWNTDRTTTNFLSKLGTHASPIPRALGATMRAWMPCWEGQGTKAVVKSGIGFPDATASFLGSPAPIWTPGMLTGGGGGHLPAEGGTPALNARWGNGRYWGGSPLVPVEVLRRRWRDVDGWDLELEGSVEAPTLGRPLEEIDERLRAIETVERAGTGEAPLS